MGKKLSLVLLVAAIVATGWIYFRRNAAPPGFDRSKNVMPPEMARVLKDGESFVLLSLDPTPASVREPLDEPSVEVFHNYAVLGKTQIPDPKEQEELLRALQRGISESDGAIMLCFNPRHGISATLGKEKAELVICFECLSIETHSTKGRGNGLTTSRSPEELFDRALEKAGIAKATKNKGENDKSLNPGFE